MNIIRLNDAEEDVLMVSEDNDLPSFYCPFSGIEMINDFQANPKLKVSKRLELFLVCYEAEEPIYISKSFKKHLNTFEKKHGEDDEFSNGYEDDYFNNSNHCSSFYLYLKEKLESKNEYTSFELILTDTNVPSWCFSCVLIYRTA